MTLTDYQAHTLVNILKDACIEMPRVSARREYPAVFVDALRILGVTKFEDIWPAHTPRVSCLCHQCAPIKQALAEAK